MSHEKLPFPHENGPDCPKSKNCSGAIVTQTSIYIPKCLFIGDTGILNEYATYKCPACGSTIRYRYMVGKKYWEVYKINKT